MKESPMLCAKGEWDRLSLVPDDWVLERKLDGTRILAFKDPDGHHSFGKVRLINRRGVDKAHAYPEIVSALQAIPGEFTLDGEMCVIGPDGRANFSSLGTRDHVSDRTKIRILSRAKPATFFCFDLLLWDATQTHYGNLTNDPLRRRKDLLLYFFEKNGPFSGSPPPLAFLAPESREGLVFLVERGEIEGIVAKDPESPYRSERSSRWVKFRKYDTDDIPIIGYQTSDKEGRSGVRSLLGLLNGREIAVASGLDGADLEAVALKFQARPHRIENGEAGGKRLLIEPPYPLAEVEHFRTEGMVVRFPRFVRWRAG